MIESEIPLFHTVPQACRRLALGRSKLYELITNGHLRPVKVGRRTLLSETELQRFACQLIERGVS